MEKLKEIMENFVSIILDLDMENEKLKNDYEHSKELTKKLQKDFEAEIKDLEDDIEFSKQEIEDLEKDIEYGKQRFKKSQRISENYQALLIKKENK